MRELLLGMLVASVATAGLAASQVEIDADAALFDRYIELEHDFDPEMAELYADDAVIKNTRRYPTGQVRELELTGVQYKALLRQAMPLAKVRGDRSTYSNIAFQVNGGGTVSIKAARYSELKKYTSPLEITVAPDEEGKWQIIEELSESQP